MSLARVTLVVAENDEVRVDVRALPIRKLTDDHIHRIRRAYDAAYACETYGPRHMIGNKRMPVRVIVPPATGEPGDPWSVELALTKVSHAGPALIKSAVSQALDAWGWSQSADIEVYGVPGDSGILVFAPELDARLDAAIPGLRRLFTFSRTRQYLTLQQLEMMGADELYHRHSAKRRAEDSTGGEPPAKRWVDFHTVVRAFKTAMMEMQQHSAMHPALAV